jgi:hypothetical protein
MASMDYCAAAFRFFAKQNLGRALPLQFKMDRKLLDSSEKFEIWEITTANTVFDGLPAICHLLITLGPDHARVVQENNVKIAAEKPEIKILGAASWDKEGFSAIATADTKVTPEDALFFGNLN